MKTRRLHVLFTNMKSNRHAWNYDDSSGNSLLCQLERRERHRLLQAERPNRAWPVGQLLNLGCGGPKQCPIRSILRIISASVAYDRHGRIEPSKLLVKLCWYLIGGSLYYSFIINIFVTELSAHSVEYTIDSVWCGSDL